MVYWFPRLKVKLVVEIKISKSFSDCKAHLSGIYTLA
jgi:hypothetical protein